MIKVKEKRKIDWNLITSLIASIGLLLTAYGLFYTAQQIELSRQVARSEFMREFYNSIQQYNDIQLKLSKGGEWRDVGNIGPEKREDWFRLQRYMGLIEQVDDWYIDGIMSIENIDNAYSHRIKAIYTHQKIREELLIKESYRWNKFNHLVSSLKNKPTFNKIQYDTLVQELNNQPK